MGAMTGPRQPARNRVVVTGLGATTALGGDVGSTWAAMLRGESGVALAEEGDARIAHLPAVPVARARVEPGPELEPLTRRRLGRCAQFATVAADEAWRDAGLHEASVDPRRVAAVVAAAMVDTAVVIDAWETLKDRGWSRVPPWTIPMFMGNSAAAAVSVLVDARAGAHSTVSACSSGAQALTRAADLIRDGRADVVVAGGAEAPVHPFLIGAFAAVRALSQRVDDPQAASRPYDAERDGLVLGEGAGILVLESKEHALARGARIYAELGGVGVTSDAHHLVQPEPGGTAHADAIRLSLDDAGVAATDVAHVNGNGNGTVTGDAAEVRALCAVFGDASAGPALTATKSMIGHTLGAAGAIESIATILAIHHAVVPPTRNFTRLDEGLSVDVVHDGPRRLPAGELFAVKSASGFGGHNVVLTFCNPPAPG
jgi:3-oxoacyl-[acyl-carrier-protein] synthase II